MHLLETQMTFRLSCRAEMVGRPRFGPVECVVCPGAIAAGIGDDLGLFAAFPVLYSSAYSLVSK